MTFDPRAQALEVSFMVDFAPGKPIRWAALSQQPPHLAGQGSTPVGYGPSAVEALAALGVELQARADAMGGREPEPEGAEAVEVHVHRALTHDEESDRVWCVCGAWRLADSEHWTASRG